MKKLFLFTLVVPLFFSCSSDDTPLDPFIGSWQAKSVSLTLNDGSTQLVELAECDQPINIYALREGGFILEISAYDEEYEGCYIHITTYQSNWNKLSENQYFVEMKFYYTHPYLLDPGEYYEEGEMSFMLDVSFPDEKIMYIYNQELLGFYPTPILDEGVVSYSIIYEKIGSGIE